MRNICFLLSEIHGNGGISRVTWIVTNKLCNDYNVHVLAGSKSKQIKYNYDQRIHVDCLFEDLIPVHKRFFSMVSKLHRYIKSNSIEAVICAGVMLYPVASMATVGTGAKLFCWEHSNVSVVNEFRYQRICRFIGVKFSDRIITLTDEDKLMFETKYNINKCIRIYNPVDERLMVPVLYNSDSKKIISVGRLCYQKNFERLVEIASKVLNENSEWEWHIYGEGPNRSTIEKLIEEYHINGKLVLKGNNPNLYEKYKDYSFLVMTSRFEGFPMTLLESTASGIPAISFDVKTGPKEVIVNEKTGYLVEEKDTELMITRINELIGSKELRERMSKNCIEHRNKFSLSNVIDQWNNLLR